MKSILIPVDFSEYSKASVTYGVALAKRTGAELFLLHVFDGPDDWNRIPVESQQDFPQIESRMVEAEVKMDKLLEEKIFKGVKATGIVRPGIIQEQIQRFSKQYKADLIIMGAHGKGDSKRFFIGSQAQKILRTAACPVFSVKKDFKPKAIKRIVFAADFIEDKASGFGSLVPFAKATKAQIDIVFINTPANFRDTMTMEKAMDRFVSAYPQLKFKKHIFNALNVEEGILQFATLCQAQVIAKITKNRQGKAGYDIGITESLLFNARLPVLSATVL